METTEKLITWDDILKGLYIQAPAATDPAIAQADILAAAQAEANRNPLIVVSIVIGLMRLMSKK